MKYYVVSITDGNFVVCDEGKTDIEAAKQSFHHWCELLLSDKGFSTGVVKLLDENLDCVEQKMEFITHTVQATPAEPVEE